MEKMKKLEIIIDALELNSLLDMLEACGVTGYTVLRNVTGKGDRGMRSDDEVTGVFKNSYVMVACDGEMAMILAEKIRPLLKRFGGICLISDAEFLTH